MWLAIKESILKDAAGRVKDPADKLLVNELGVQGAIRYRRLLDRFPASEAPEAQRGPDETISDHASRLEKRLKDELAAGQSEREQAREQGRLKPQTTIEQTQQAPVTMPWVGDLPTAAPAAPSDLGGMPRRIPHQYTTGNPEFGTKPFPDWEVPPANQPLHTAPRAPMRAPEPQSMQDWVNFLRGKGITVNHQLMRPDAVQMQGPMLQGQNIWKDFVGPTTPDSLHQYLKDQPAGPNTFGRSLHKWFTDTFGGRRRVRSNTIVNEYISGVLTGEVLPKIAAAGDSYEDHVAKFNARQKMMKDEGWNFHESGSGNWWEHPETGHKIMYDTARDRDGNIQEGYTHHKPGGVPTFYPTLHEALLASKVGSLGHISVKPPLGPRLNAA